MTLSRSLCLLANDDRRRLVEILASAHHSREMSITQLAGECDLTRFSASRHLRMMSDAGIVTSRAAGASRLNSLRSEPFERIEDWLIDVLDMIQKTPVPPSPLSNRRADP